MINFFANLLSVIVVFAFFALVATVNVLAARLISGDFDGFGFFALVLVLLALESAAVMTFF